MLENMIFILAIFYYYKATENGTFSAGLDGRLILRDKFKTPGHSQILGPNTANTYILAFD